MPSRLTENSVFRHPITADHLAEFQEWERGAASEMVARYHLIPAQVAFELRASDVLARDPAVEIHAADGQTVLVRTRTGERVEIGTVDAAALAEVLDAIDGTSSLAQLSARVAGGRVELASLCRTRARERRATGELDRDP
jgi:hypothetical protein